MSTSSPAVSVRPLADRPAGSPFSSLRTYFASDKIRTAQTVLGLIWLLDGALQFQAFMYGSGFIQMLKAMTAGQPAWLADSVNWGANTLHSGQVPFNTVFALIQVAIGAGLLFRPTVRPALAVSFAWAIVVWWFGEAFGMLFMAMASPLTGAPGAVSLYVIVGLLVWPGGRPGGLLGVRGARITWGALWVLMAWLWLEAPSSAANAITNSINAAPSGMSWLSTVQNWAASAVKGDGLAIAIVLALASAAIGLAVATNWRPKPFLTLAIVLSLAYWVFGQGLGGIFQGGATDPNSGPLFVLMACVMWTLVPFEAGARDYAIARSRPAEGVGTRQ